MENFSVNFPNICVAKTEHLSFIGVRKTEQVYLDFYFVLWYNKVVGTALSLERKVFKMASTRTFKELWERYEKFQQDYHFLLDSAYDDGSTLPQYAGSERLTKMATELTDLLDETMGLNEVYRREIQAAVISVLYPVELALSDARVLECKQAEEYESYAPSKADSDDYESRPCPMPKIL